MKIGKIIDGEKKVEKKNDNLKNALKDLWYMLEGIEFAEARNDEKLKKSYEVEALALLRAIKNTYKDQILKVI